MPRETYDDGPLDFTSLVKRFETADGAMAVHLRKLEDAGYIACKRQFIGRRPRSTYSITAAGRKALRRYLATMQRISDLAASEPRKSLLLLDFDRVQCCTQLTR